MSVEAIALALMGELNTAVVLPSGIATEWPNSPFTQPSPAAFASPPPEWYSVGFEWRRTDLLSRHGCDTPGAALYRHSGAMLVSSLVPSGLMDGRGLEIANSVATAMQKREIGGVHVLGANVETRGRIGIWWRVDTQLPFYSDAEVPVPATVRPWSRQTPDDAHDVIRTRFCTEVAQVEPILVLWDNAPDAPALNVEHIRTAVTLAGTDRVELGPGGMHRSVGVATAQIHVGVGIGIARPLELADLVFGAFANVTDRGVACGTPVIRAVGRFWPWWRLNVRIPFEIEE